MTEAMPPQAVGRTAPQSQVQRKLVVSIGAAMVVLASFLTWVEIPFSGGRSLLGAARTVSDFDAFVTTVPKLLFVGIAYLIPFMGVVAWLSVWWPGAKPLPDGVPLLVGLGTLISTGALVLLVVSQDPSLRPGPVVAALGAMAVMVGALLPLGEGARPLPTTTNPAPQTGWLPQPVAAAHGAPVWAPPAQPTAAAGLPAQLPTSPPMWPAAPPPTAPTPAPPTPAPSSWAPPAPGAPAPSTWAPPAPGAPAPASPPPVPGATDHGQGTDEGRWA